MFGAWAVDSDRVYGINKVSVLIGGVVGAIFGGVSMPSSSSITISKATESAISGGISNVGGQIVSIIKNPSQNHFSPASLAFSSWGAGFAGYITKDITVSLSKAFLESTIQTPFDGIGSHL
jgi:hypothetical protein